MGADIVLTSQLGLILTVVVCAGVLSLIVFSLRRKKPQVVTAGDPGEQVGPSLAETETDPPGGSET